MIRIEDLNPINNIVELKDLTKPLATCNLCILLTLVYYMGGHTPTEIYTLGSREWIAWLWWCVITIVVSALWDYVKVMWHPQPMSALISLKILFFLHHLLIYLLLPLYSFFWYKTSSLLFIFLTTFKIFGNQTNKVTNFYINFPSPLLSTPPRHQPNSLKWQPSQLKKLLLEKLSSTRYRNNTLFHALSIPFPIVFEFAST